MVSYDGDFSLDFPSQYSVDLRADKDGMLGRACLDDDCKKYFKVDMNNLSSHQQPKICCPYCGANGNIQSFSTQDQINYAASVVMRNVLGKFGNELKKLEVRPDPGALISFGISVELGQLPPLKHYLEHEIKKVIKCSRCTNSFAVYGISYFCPFCGPRDYLDVFLENIELTKKKIKIEELLGAGKDILQNEGLITNMIENALEDCITIFETYCKNVYLIHRLAQVPKLNEKQLRNSIGTSFQNIERANSLFKSEFGFEMIGSISKEDLKKVSKSFCKRHVLIHNSGIIDYRYIEQTGDDMNLLGRRVIVNSGEVKTLLDILSIMILDLDKKIRIRS